jgi:hypothetical protein
MHAKAALLASAGIAALGCGHTQDSTPVRSVEKKKPAVVVGDAGNPPKVPPKVIHAPGRPVSAPDRVNRNPTVTDDPAEVAVARKLFDRDSNERYQSALNAVREGANIYAENWFFEQRKNQAVVDLKRIVSAGPAASDLGRARAAFELMRLGDPAGDKFLFESLRAKQPPLREAALFMLNELEFHPEFSDPEKVRLALSLIDDKEREVSIAAAHLCARRKLPGTEAKLVALLKRDHSDYDSLYARDLAEVVESPAAIGVMLTHLLKDRPKQYDQFMDYRLGRLIRSPNPEISDPVRTALRNYALSYVGEDRLDFSLVRDLNTVAEAGMEGVLAKIAAKQARDPLCRFYAEEALARLDPKNTLDRLLELVRRGEPYDMTVDALARFASEKDADRIISTLLADQKKPRRAISRSVARLLFERLRARGRTALEGVMDKLDPEARMWAIWKLKGFDLGMAIDDLHAAGVVNILRAPLLEQVRRDPEFLAEHDPFDPTDSDTLVAALGHAGIFTTFDTETGMVPCHHDDLIKRFVKNSGGRFIPDGLVQTWNRKDEHDGNAPFTVQFFYKGRLYRFGAENRGDWYDVAAVHRALNFALSTAGQKDRFLALKSSGQAASFVFAVPDSFEPIAKKYGLPLSSDPDEAMRKGKEFEERAIKRLQE